MQTICVYAPLIGYGVHTYLRDEIERLAKVAHVVVVSIVKIKGGWEPSCPCFYTTELNAGDLEPTRDWSKLLTNYTAIPDVAMKAFAAHGRYGRITAFLREHKVTGIFAQWLHESVPLLDQAQELSLPYIVRSHGTDIAAGQMDPSVRRAYQRYHGATAILTGGPFASTLVEGLGFPATLVKAVPFGMELAAEQASPMSRPDRINVLCVSRVERMKGSIFSLEGFRLAAEQDARLFLNIVGSGSVLPAIEQMIQAFDLEGRVKVWGHLANKGPELARLWAESDIFVQASVRVAEESSIETFGVSVLEAMSHGLPTIVSSSQALPELVADQECGLVVPEADAGAIATALLGLVADPERTRRFGLAALQRVREHFSPERQLQRIFEAFDFSGEESLLSIREVQ